MSRSRSGTTMTDRDQGDRCDQSGRPITTRQGPNLHQICRTGGVSRPRASTYTPSHTSSHNPVSDKVLPYHQIPPNLPLPDAAHWDRGEVGERPTAKLAFCGPGRCSSVTPAGPVAPHRMRPSRKGAHGRGRRPPPTGRAPDRRVNQSTRRPARHRCRQAVPFGLATLAMYTSTPS